MGQEIAEIVETKQPEGSPSQTPNTKHWQEIEEISGNHQATASS
jgi:hypothetical protein